MISFAGVQLSQPTEELRDWARGVHAPSLCPELTIDNWLPDLRSPGVILNRLAWPVGAGRFGWGFFVTSEKQLEAIRLKVYGNPADYATQPLVFSSGNRSLSFQMRALVPIPLSQFAGSNPVSLLPLVDDRFFWGQRWFTPNYAAGDTWEKGIAAVNNAFGLKIRPRGTLSLSAWKISAARPEKTSLREALVACEAQTLSVLLPQPDGSLELAARADAAAVQPQSWVRNYSVISGGIA
jgi:hypothetical protein